MYRIWFKLLLLLVCRLKFSLYILVGICYNSIKIEPSQDLVILPSDSLVPSGNDERYGLGSNSHTRQCAKEVICLSPVKPGTEIASFCFVATGGFWNYVSTFLRVAKKEVVRLYEIDLNRQRRNRSQSSDYEETTAVRHLVLNKGGIDNERVVACEHDRYDGQS